MKNAKNNHQFTIWEKVVSACGLRFKRIKLTKTSDITFLRQFNHSSTKGREREKRQQRVIGKTTSYCVGRGGGGSSMSFLWLFSTLNVWGTESESCPKPMLLQILHRLKQTRCHLLQLWRKTRTKLSYVWLCLWFQYPMVSTHWFLGFSNTFTVFPLDSEHWEGVDEPTDRVGGQPRYISLNKIRK